MSSLKNEPRSFLFGMGALAMMQALPQAGVAQAPLPQGYVLAAGEGERLVHFRDHT